MKLFSKTKLKAYFFTGLFTSLPVMATVVVGWFILKFVINLLSLPLSGLLDLKLPAIKLIVPLAGLIITIMVILVIGLLMASFIGKTIIAWFEELLARVPIVSNIYTGFKQLIEIFLMRGKESFSRVVLVEYPRKGIYAVGFVTSEANPQIGNSTGKEVVNIYLPTALNIASGFLIVAPVSEIIPLNISVEEGLKLVISGGFIVPSDKFQLPNEVSRIKISEKVEEIRGNMSKLQNSKSQIPKDK
ncbi:MAG: DUF502 domain-containing protein [bacterium]